MGVLGFIVLIGLLFFTKHGKLFLASCSYALCSMVVAVLRGGWVFVPIAIVLRFME